MDNVFVGHKIHFLSFKNILGFSVHACAFRFDAIQFDCIRYFKFLIIITILIEIFVETRKCSRRNENRSCTKSTLKFIDYNNNEQLFISYLLET